MTSDSSEAQAVAPHSLTADDVLSALNSDSECGLTSEEASQRLRRFGPNRLKAAPQVPAWRKFLAQFTDILVLLLIAAALVSALLWLLDRDTALPYEAIAIAAIVILNAVMGYVQRARAEKAVQALRQMTAPQASVIRDGERQEIPALGLVPGDIISLEAGDIVYVPERVF